MWLLLLLLAAAVAGAQTRSCTRDNDGAIMNDVTTRDVYRCHGRAGKWVNRGPRLRPPPRDLVPTADNVVLMRMCAVELDMQHLIGPHECNAANSGFLIACLEPRKRYVCNWDEDSAAWVWRMRTK